jgi:carboxyl-terminal processing protease
LIELYEENREEKLDSLKKLRSPFFTRGGRRVYGGGGITPDVHIPWDLELSDATRRVLASPTRPMFNWSAAFVREQKDLPDNYRKFQNDWELPQKALDAFFSFVKKESIGFDSSGIKENEAYLRIILKSEIAGAKWGRNELWGVRTMSDNQVLSALKYFNEADAFLVGNN